MGGGWSSAVWLAGAAALAACASPAEDAAGQEQADAAAEVEPDAPAGHTGGVPLPASGDVPGTDFDEHIVPLADIHFDTFDGRSVPLSEASAEVIERLRDAIPPIEQTVYVGPGEAPLAAEELVLGYVTDAGQAYAYPIGILNFHEIINEELDGAPLLITYCPLCRSGVVYDRRLDGRELTFGNTSALYDNDMVMYDHQTNSYWWHIAGRAIVGELSGVELTPLPSRLAAWEEWRERHPDTLVLSTETGFDRPYERDPFSGYRERVNRGDRPFPNAEASRSDPRLDDGEEVLGVVLDGAARAYALRVLGDSVVNDELGGVPLVVLSQAQGPTGAAFDRRLDDRTLTFAVADDRIVDEQTGSTWGLDGRATSGPLAGQQLTSLPTRSSFWFAFVAAFPDTDVYESP